MNVLLVVTLEVRSAIIFHVITVDDLCLIAISTSGMQKLLNICSDYRKKLDIEYNSVKSNTMCLLNQTMKGMSVNLSIDNVDIPVVKDCYKYLCTYISTWC